MTIYIIIAVVIIICAAYLLFFRKKGNKASYTTEITQKGAKIYSKSGTTSALKFTVDEALDKLFDDARAIGYSNKLNHADYTVFVKDDCVRAPESGILSFLIDAPNYDGSIWDQNPKDGIGQVYAAEQVMLNYGVPTGEFVICNDADLANVANTVRFGAEHILAFHNDRDFYEKTRTHSETSGHPLIPSVGV